MNTETEARLAAIEQKQDLIGYAMAEVALLAYPDLHPMSWGHDPVRMNRHAPNAMKLLRLYSSDAYADSLAEFVKEREAAQKELQHMSDEEAEELNRRLSREWSADGSRA